MQQVALTRGQSGEQAAQDYDTCIMNLGIDSVQELGYWDRKRIHNLKYFTWIEQQGKELEELNRQWYDAAAYWQEIHDSADRLDEDIRRFNALVESA